MSKDNALTLALGNFDGVHMGHRKIIEKAIEVSKGNKVYVCSFHPHPLKFLKSSATPKTLTNIKEKKRIIENDLKANYYEIAFDSHIANMSDEEFISYLLTLFKVSNIVVGANYFFGKEAKYNTNDLKNVCARHSINVYVVEEFAMLGATVSSTRIRKALKLGELTLSNKLLGRNYSVEGKCIRGKGIGNTIGFATANIEVNKQMQYPASGVYVTKCFVDGKWHISMTNIGNNPTVNKENPTLHGDNPKSIETHIIDYSKVLYDKEIRVEFYERIREERKFQSVHKLIQQLKSDKEYVISFFKHSL